MPVSLGHDTVHSPRYISVDGALQNCDAAHLRGINMRRHLLRTNGYVGPARLHPTWRSWPVGGRALGLHSHRASISLSQPLGNWRRQRSCWTRPRPRRSNPARRTSDLSVTTPRKRANHGNAVPLTPPGHALAAQPGPGPNGSAAPSFKPASLSRPER